jgi:peptidoglycan/xylan/chitin deacetylase (PgdA/CDA1 family)
VRPEPDPLFPEEMHASVFRERMQWVGEWFNVLPLEDAINALVRGGLPERALAITFDDGYADNFDVAWPILRQYALPATFFIATGFLDGGRMWNDSVIEAVRRTAHEQLDLSVLNLGTYGLRSDASRRSTIEALLGKLKYLSPERRGEAVDIVASIGGAQLPCGLMMTSAQVRELGAGGMGIGGHTHTHPILTRVDGSVARREIVGGREALESIVRQPVRLFAYPNGKPVIDYSAEHVRIVRELGFSAALSTSAGAAYAGDSVYELPRFTPWGASAGRWGARLARNLLRKRASAAA